MIIDTVKDLIEVLQMYPCDYKVYHLDVITDTPIRVLELHYSDEEKKVVII